MKRIVCVLIGLCCCSLQAQTATWMNLTGTQASAFKIGPPASALTLTNSSGVLSLSGGLTANGVVTLGTSVGGFTTTGVITSSVSTGTAPFTIASTTNVANLNSDTVDGFNLAAAGDGAILYRSSSSQISGSNIASTGSVLTSNGSGAPIWMTPGAAQILMGNVSSQVTATTVTGDVTISSGGATAIGSSKVTSAMIVDGTVTSTDILNSTVASVDISDGTIAAADLAGNCVASANIIDGTIVSADIADGTIANADLGIDCVGTSQIVDEEVQMTDLHGTQVGVFIPKATGSAGAEAADTRRVTIQLREVDDSTSNTTQMLVPITMSAAQFDMQNETGTTVTFTPVTGAAFHTITANKKFLYLSERTTGLIVVDVTVTASTTIYFNYIVGAKTYSVTLVFA